VYRESVIEANCDYFANGSFATPWKNADGSTFVDLDITYNASNTPTCYIPKFPNDNDGGTYSKSQLCTWQYLQPDSGGNCSSEFCVELGDPDHSYYSGDWNDKGCEIEQAFICKRPVESTYSLSV